MVTVGRTRLTSEDFKQVLFYGKKVRLDSEALKRVTLNYNFLQSYSEDKVIYGINTGLGPMAQYNINKDDQAQLQYNLIRSHCAGSGDLFSEDISRATMLARLNGLAKGFSGVNPYTLELITELLNRNINPCIFHHGGVGASGDLIQLAHLALNLIGEGEVFWHGKLHPASEVFKHENIQPLKIYIREGLAIMNGTSAMTGVGIVNIIHANKILVISIILSSLINELMKSFDDHFSLELNQVKLHQGQQKIAEAMRSFLADSKLVRKRPDHLYHKKIDDAVFSDKVQEYYSLRCVPQILGPVYDTLLAAQKVLEDELNSVNDNPVIDHEKENVYHGGNFHGDYVSLAMDQVKTVIAKVCMLSERQTNYLLNDKLNQRLPPFINLGKLGLNFGLQGMQFSATSTTAENQTLAYPMYLHSIPNNNDNQDIVSMGCNAALITKKVIENAYDVVTVQAIAIVQAIGYLKCESKLSTLSQQFYKDVNAIIQPFGDDQPRYKEMKSVKDYLVNLEPTLLA